MKKLLILALGMILFFGGCEEKDSTTNITQLEKINIGVIAPLTGDGATYGKSMQRGMELVFNGKEKYKIYYEDSKLSVKEGLNAYKKLLSQNPYIIYGAASSGVSLGLSPLAQKNKTVLFSSISTSDKLLDSGKYFLRNVPTNNIQGQTAAKFLINTLKLKKIAIYNENDEYGMNLAKSFKQTATELGIEIVLENSYDANKNDFKTFLSKIKIDEVEAVFIPGNYEETAQILKQARELSLSKVIFIGGDGSYSPKVAKIAGKDIDNFYCTIMGIDKTTQFYKNFLKEFKAKYNIEPDTYDAYAYEAAKIIFNTLENVKSKDEVVNYLYINSFNSLTSSQLTFNESGDISREYGIMKLENGNFKSVK